MSRISRRAHGRAALATLAATATALAGSVVAVDTAVAEVNDGEISIPDEKLYDNPFSGVTISILAFTLVPVLTQDGDSRTLHLYHQDAIVGSGSGDYVEEGARPFASMRVDDGLISIFGGLVAQVSQEAAAGAAYVPVAGTDENGDATVSFYAAGQLDNSGQPKEGEVAQATVSIPAGQDGNSITMVDNNNGTVTLQIVDGAGNSVGEAVTISNGQDGADGRDGRGVEQFIVDEDGNVTVEYTGGETQQLGNFRGEDGTTYVPVMTDGTHEGRSGTWVRFYDEDDLDENGQPVEDAVVIAEGFVANGVDGEDGAAGQDGANGADGEDGVDGNSVTVTRNADGSVTIQMVDANNEPVGESVIIPAPVNGEDGADGQDGEDGADGQDGEDGADGTTYAPVLTEGTNDEGRSGTWVRFYDEDDLNENGQPNEDAEAVSEAFVTDGAAGNSVTVTKNDDGSVTIQMVDADGNAVGDPVIIDAPVDGQNGKDGADGKDGAKGQSGTNGQDGAKGQDGRGIESIDIDEDGNFVVTYTDGETDILEPTTTDNNLSSNLSSESASPLLLIIPAIIAAIAALNIPTIQAALTSIAGGLF